VCWNEAKKATRYVLINNYSGINIEYTQNAHTSDQYYYVTCFTTLDFKYRHENKGTDLVLVPRKCGILKWDQRATKYACIQYRFWFSTHKMLIFTYTKVTNIGHLFTKLDYEYRYHENKGTDLFLVPTKCQVGCINETTKSYRCVQYWLVLSTRTRLWIQTDGWWGDYK
jgi:hypothetical protein